MGRIKVTMPDPLPLDTGPSIEPNSEPSAQRLLGVIDLSEPSALSYQELRSIHSPKGRVVSNAKALSKHEILESYFEREFHAASSKKITLDFVRKIKSRRKVLKETKEYLHLVRNYISYVHKYNLNLFRYTQTYPFCEEFIQLLVQYVLLECKVLYKRENYSKTTENLTALRIIRLLLNLYDEYFSTKQFSKSKVLKHSVEAIIRIFVTIKFRYNANYPILETMTVKLLKKSGRYETITKLQEQYASSYIHAYSDIDPSLRGLCRNVSSDYGTDDGNSNEPVIIDDSDEELPTVHEEATDEDDLEIKIEAAKISQSEYEVNSSKSKRLVYTICLDESGLESDEELSYFCKESETRRQRPKRRSKNARRINNICSESTTVGNDELIRELDDIISRENNCTTETRVRQNSNVNIIELSDGDSLDCFNATIDQHASCTEVKSEEEDSGDDIICLEDKTDNGSVSRETSQTLLHNNSTPAKDSDVSSIADSTNQMDLVESMLVPNECEVNRRSGDEYLVTEPDTTVSTCSELDSGKIVCVSNATSDENHSKNTDTTESTCTEIYSIKSICDSKATSDENNVQKYDEISNRNILEGSIFHENSMTVDVLVSAESHCDNLIPQFQSSDDKIIRKKVDKQLMIRLEKIKHLETTSKISDFKTKPIQSSVDSDYDSDKKLKKNTETSIGSKKEYSLSSYSDFEEKYLTNLMLSSDYETNVMEEKTADSNIALIQGTQIVQDGDIEVIARSMTDAEISQIAHKIIDMESDGLSADEIQTVQRLSANLITPPTETIQNVQDGKVSQCNVDSDINLTKTIQEEDVTSINPKSTDFQSDSVRSSQKINDIKGQLIEDRDINIEAVDDLIQVKQKESDVENSDNSTQEQQDKTTTLIEQESSNADKDLFQLKQKVFGDEHTKISKENSDGHSDSDVCSTQQYENINTNPFDQEIYSSENDRIQLKQKACGGEDTKVSNENTDDPSDGNVCSTNTNPIDQESYSSESDRIQLKQKVCGGEDTKVSNENSDGHSDSDVCSTQQHEDINTNPFDQESYNSESDRIQLKQKVCGGEDTKVSNENTDDPSDGNVCSTNTNPIDQESYSSESDRIQLKQKVCGGEDTKVINENSDGHSDSDVCSTQQYENINTNPFDQEIYSSENDRIQLKQKACGGEDTKVSNENTDDPSDGNVCSTNTNPIDQESYSSESDRIQLKQKVCGGEDTKISKENSDGHSDSDVCSTQQYENINTNPFDQEIYSSENDRIQLKQKACGGEDTKVSNENTDDPSDGNVCSTNTNPIDQESYSSESDRIQLKQKVCGGEDTKVINENSDGHSDSDVCSTQQHEDINTNPFDQESYNSESDRIQLKQKVCGGEDTKVSNENSDGHSDSDVCSTQQHEDINTNPIDQEIYSSESDPIQLNQTVCGDEDTEVSDETSHHSNRERICLTLEHKDNNPNLIEQEDIISESDLTQLKEKTIDDKDSKVCDENSDYSCSDMKCLSQEHKNTDLTSQEGSNLESDLIQFKEKIIDNEDSKVSDENSDRFDSNRSCSTQDHKNIHLTNQEGSNSESDLFRFKEKIIDDEDSKLCDENSDHFDSDSILSTEEHKNTVCTNQEKLIDDEDSKVSDNSDHTDSYMICLTQEHKNIYLTNQEGSNSESDLIGFEEKIIDGQDSKVCDENSDHVDSDSILSIEEHKNTVCTNQETLIDDEDNKVSDENRDHFDGDKIFSTQEHKNTDFTNKEWSNSEEDLSQLEEKIIDDEDGKVCDENNDHSDSDSIFSTQEHKNTDFTNQEGSNSEKNLVQQDSDENCDSDTVSSIQAQHEDRNDNVNDEKYNNSEHDLIQLKQKVNDIEDTKDSDENSDHFDSDRIFSTEEHKNTYFTNQEGSNSEKEWRVQLESGDENSDHLDSDTVSSTQAQHEDRNGNVNDQSKQNVRDIEDTNDRDENSDHLDSNKVYSTQTHYGDGNANVNDEICYNSESDLIQLKQSLSDIEDTKESDTNSDIICASLEQIEKINTKTINEDRCSSESHQIRQPTVHGDEDTKVSDKNVNYSNWSKVDSEINELTEVVVAHENDSNEDSDFFDSEVCSRQVLHEIKTISTVDDQSAISITDLVQPSLEVDDEGAELIVEETMELETDFIEVSQEEVTAFCYLEGANELEHPEIDDIEHNDDLCQISEDNQTINVEKPLQEIENFKSNDSSFTEEVTPEFEGEHTSEISKTQSLVDEPSCLHEKEISTSQMLEQTEDSGEHITHIKENITHVNIETSVGIKELNEAAQITENDEIISESELDIQTDVVVEIYKQDSEDNINTDEQEMNTIKDSEPTSNLEHKIEIGSEELLYRDEQIVECSENVAGESSLVYENIKESKKEAAVVSDHLQQVTNDLQCVNDDINRNAPNTNLLAKNDNNEENISANLADTVLSQSKNGIQEIEKSSEHIEDSFVNEVIVGTNVEKQDDILLEIEDASNQTYTEVGGKEIVPPEDKSSIIFGTQTTVVANEEVFPTSAEPVHPVQLLHGAVTSDWSKINSVDRSFSLNNLNWDIYKEAVVTQESRGGLDLLANTAERIRDQETEIYVPSTKKQRKSIPRKLDLKKLQRKIVRRKQKNYVTKGSENDEKRVTRSAYRRHLIDDILKPQEFRNTPPINNVKIHQLPDIITTKDTTDTDSNDSECNKLFIDDNKDNDFSVYDQDTQEHLEFRSKVSPPTTTTVSKKTIKIKRSVRKTAKKEISRTNESTTKLMVNIHTDLISEETSDGFFEENTTSNKPQTHVELQTAKKTESCNKTNAETPLIDVNASKTESCSKTNAETNFRNDYQILGHQSLHYSVSTPPKLRYKLACKNNVKSMVEKMERVKAEEIQHQVNSSHANIRKVPLDTPGGEENYLPMDVSTASSGHKKSTPGSMNLVDTFVTPETTNKSIESYNKVFITNVDIDSSVQVSNIEVVSNMRPKIELWKQESVKTHKNVDNTIIEKITYDKNVTNISRQPQNIEFTTKNLEIRRQTQISQQELVKVPEEIDVVCEIETKTQSDDPNVNIQKPNLEIRCKKMEKRRKTEILKPQSDAVPDTVDDIASLEELDANKQPGNNIDSNINNQISNAEIGPKKVRKRRRTQVCDDISSLKEFDADKNIDSSINQVPNVELAPKKVGKRRKTQVLQLTPKNIDDIPSPEDAKKQPDINIDPSINHQVPKVEFTPRKVGRRRKTPVLQLDSILAPENIGAISSLEELNAEKQPDINIDPSINHQVPNAEFTSKKVGKRRKTKVLQLEPVTTHENIDVVSSLKELNDEKQPDINIDPSISHLVPNVEFTSKKLGKRRKTKVFQLEPVTTHENIDVVSSLKELNDEKQLDINIDPCMSHQVPNVEFTSKKVGKRRKTQVLQLDSIIAPDNKADISSLKKINDEEQPDMNIDPSISYQVPNVEFTCKKVGKRRKTQVLQLDSVTASKNIDTISPLDGLNAGKQAEINIDPSIIHQVPKVEFTPKKVGKRRKTQVLQLDSIIAPENIDTISSLEELNSEKQPDVNIDPSISHEVPNMECTLKKEGKRRKTKALQLKPITAPENVDDVSSPKELDAKKQSDNIDPSINYQSYQTQLGSIAVSENSFEEHAILQTNIGVNPGNLKEKLNNTEFVQQESVGSPESVDDIPLDIRMSRVKRGSQEGGDISSLEYTTVNNISPNLEEISLTEKQIFQKIPNEEIQETVQQTGVDIDTNLQHPNVEVSLNNSKDNFTETLQNESIGSPESADDIPLHLRLLQVEHGVEEKNRSQDFLVKSLLTSGTGYNISKHVEETLVQSEIVNKSSSESQEIGVDENNLSENVKNRENSLLKKIKILSDVLISPKKEVITSTIAQKQSKLEDLEVTDTLPSKIVLDSNQNTSERFSTKDKRKRGRATNRKNAEILPEGMNKALVNEDTLNETQTHLEEGEQREIVNKEMKIMKDRQDTNKNKKRTAAINLESVFSDTSKKVSSKTKYSILKPKDIESQDTKNKKSSRSERSKRRKSLDDVLVKAKDKQVTFSSQIEEIRRKDVSLDIEQEKRSEKKNQVLKNWNNEKEDQTANLDKEKVDSLKNEMENVSYDVSSNKKKLNSTHKDNILGKKEVETQKRKPRRISVMYDEKEVDDLIRKYVEDTSIGQHQMTVTAVVENKLKHKSDSKTAVQIQKPKIQISVTERRVRNDRSKSCTEYDISRSKKSSNEKSLRSKSASTSEIDKKIELDKPKLLQDSMLPTEYTSKRRSRSASKDDNQKIISEECNELLQLTKNPEKQPNIRKLRSKSTCITESEKMLKQPRKLSDSTLKIADSNERRLRSKSLVTPETDHSIKLEQSVPKPHKNNDDVITSTSEIAEQLPRRILRSKTISNESLSDNKQDESLLTNLPEKKLSLKTVLNTEVPKDLPETKHIATEQKSPTECSVKEKLELTTLSDDTQDVFNTTLKETITTKAANFLSGTPKESTPSASKVTDNTRSKTVKTKYHKEHSSLSDTIATQSKFINAEDQNLPTLSVCSSEIESAVNVLEASQNIRETRKNKYVPIKEVIDTTKTKDQTTFIDKELRVILYRDNNENNKTSTKLQEVSVKSKEKVKESIAKTHTIGLDLGSETEITKVEESEQKITGAEESTVTGHKHISSSISADERKNCKPDVSINQTPCESQITVKPIKDRLNLSEISSSITHNAIQIHAEPKHIVVEQSSLENQINNDIKLTQSKYDSISEVTSSERQNTDVPTVNKPDIMSEVSSSELYNEVQADHTNRIECVDRLVEQVPLENQIIENTSEIPEISSSETCNEIQDSQTKPITESIEENSLEGQTNTDIKTTEDISDGISEISSSETYNKIQQDVIKSTKVPDEQMSISDCVMVTEDKSDEISSSKTSSEIQEMKVRAGDVPDDQMSTENQINDSIMVTKDNSVEVPEITSSKILNEIQEVNVRLTDLPGNQKLTENQINVSILATEDNSDEISSSKTSNEVKEVDVLSTDVPDNQISTESEIIDSVKVTADKSDEISKISNKIQEEKVRSDVLVEPIANVYKIDDSVEVLEPFDYVKEDPIAIQEHSISLGEKSISSPSVEAACSLKGDFIISEKPQSLVSEQHYLNLNVKLKSRKSASRKNKVSDELITSTTVSDNKHLKLDKSIKRTPVMSESVDRSKSVKKSSSVLDNKTKDTKEVTLNIRVLKPISRKERRKSTPQKILKIKSKINLTDIMASNTELLEDKYERKSATESNLKMDTTDLTTFDQQQENSTEERLITDATKDHEEEKIQSETLPLIDNENPYVGLTSSNIEENKLSTVSLTQQSESEQAICEVTNKELTSKTSNISETNISSSCEPMNQSTNTELYKNNSKEYFSNFELIPIQENVVVNKVSTDYIGQEKVEIENNSGFVVNDAHISSSSSSDEDLKSVKVNSEICSNLDEIKTQSTNLTTTNSPIPEDPQIDAVVQTLEDDTGKTFETTTQLEYPPTVVDNDEFVTRSAPIFPESLSEAMQENQENTSNANQNLISTITNVPNKLETNSDDHDTFETAHFASDIDFTCSKTRKSSLNLEFDNGISNNNLPVTNIDSTKTEVQTSIMTEDKIIPNKTKVQNIPPVEAVVTHNPMLNISIPKVDNAQYSSESLETPDIEKFLGTVPFFVNSAQQQEPISVSGFQDKFVSNEKSTVQVVNQENISRVQDQITPPEIKKDSLILHGKGYRTDGLEENTQNTGNLSENISLLLEILASAENLNAINGSETTAANKNGDVVAYNQDNQSPVIPVSVEKIINEFKYPQSPVKVLQKRKVLPEKFQSLSQSFATGYPNYDSEPSTSTGIYASRRNKKPVASLGNQHSSSWDIPDVSCNEEVVSTELAPNDYSSLEDMSQSLVLASDNPQENQNQALMPSAEQAMSYRDLDPEVFPADFADFCTKMSVTETTSYVVEKSWIPSPFGLSNQFNHPFFNHFNLVPKYRDVRSQQISISRTISTTITDSNMYPYPDIMPTADRRITSKKEIKLVNRFNQANADVAVNCNELTASNNLALENYIAQGSQQSGNSQLRAITDGKNDHNYSYFAGDPVMSIAEEGGDMSPNAKEFGNVILNCENDNEFLDSTAPLLDLDLSDENSTRRGTESFPSWDPEPKVTVENSEQFDDETSSVIMEFIVDHSIADAWNQQETVDNEIQTFPVSNFDLFSQESLNQGGDTFNNSTTLPDEIASSRVEPLEDDVNINICSSLSLSPDDDELPLMNTNAGTLYQKPETTDIDLYSSFDELNQKTTPPTTLLKVDHVVPEKPADIPKLESKEDIPSKTDNKSKRVAQQLALYKKLNSKKAKEVNQNDSKQNSMEIPSRQSVRISPRTWTRQSASPMSVKTSPSSQEGSPKTVEQSPTESPIPSSPSEPVILNFKLKNLLQSGIETDNLNTLEKVKNTKVDVAPEQSTETPSVEATRKTEEIAPAKTATKKLDSTKFDAKKKEHNKVDSTNVKDECTKENIKEPSKTDNKTDKKKEHSKIISKPERKVEVNDSDTSKIDTTKKASRNDTSKIETNRNDQSENRKEITKTDAYKIETKKEVNKKDSKSDNKKGVTQIDDKKSESNRSDSNKTEKKKEHHKTEVSKTESRRERSTTNITKSGTNKTPTTEDNKAEIAKQSARSDTKTSYDETRSTKTSRPDRIDSSSRKKVAEDPAGNSLKQHSSSESSKSSNKEDKQFKEYPKNPRTTSISIPVKSSAEKKSEVFVSNDVSQLQSKSIPKPVLSQMAPEDCLQYENSEARSNLYDTVKSRKRAATKREPSIERTGGTSRYHHDFRPRKSKRKSPDEDSDYVKIPEKIPRIDEDRPNSSSDLKVKIRRDSSGRQYTTTPSPQSIEADSSSRQYTTSAGSSVSQNSQRYIHDSSSRRYEMGTGGSDIQNSQRHARDNPSRSHSGNSNNSGNQSSQSTGSDSSNRQYTSATPVNIQNSQIYKRDNTGRQYVSTSGSFSSHGSKSNSSSRQYSSSSGSSGSQRPQSSRQGNSDRQHPSYQSSDSQRSQSTRQENSYRQHASYQSSESQRSQSSRLDNSGRQYPPYTSPYQNTPTDNLGPNKQTSQSSSSTGYTVDEILNKSREPRECTKDKIRSNGYKRSSNGLPVSSHKPFKTSEDAFDHLVVEGNVNPFFSNQPNDPKYGINRRLDDQSSLWNKSEKSRRDSSQRYSTSRSSADFSRSTPDMKSPRCGQYRDIRSPIYLPRRPSNNKFPSSSNVISEKFQRINEGQKAPTSSDTHHYTGSGSGLSDEKKNELLEDLRNMVQRQLNKSNKSNSNYDWYQGVEPLLSDNPPGPRRE
ncbi:uncharacterized protein [Diabrotica undecimpunctata]|uniref:uncharacterized protein isoform X2 n=1 Tax=Diabrotica undecimpunctata TaxID=50387 RepID=UPI003B637049